MRHAATQTRPGVCRIHFHLRHLFVSRRSSCSVVLSRGFMVRGACVARTSAGGGLRWPTRWVEWISRPHLRRFCFPHVYRLRFTPSFAVCGKTVKVDVFTYLARCVRGRAVVSTVVWPIFPRIERHEEKREERVNRATLHSLFASTSHRCHFRSKIFTITMTRKLLACKLKLWSSLSNLKVLHRRYAAITKSSRLL